MIDRPFNVHDEVAREAFRDYDPEPDYDRPTSDELAADAEDIREWERSR